MMFHQKVYGWKAILSKNHYVEVTFSEIWKFLMKHFTEFCQISNKKKEQNRE